MSTTPELSTTNTFRSKKILVVITAGGYTNAAPLIEIARLLAQRGYIIEFGTLSGRESWTKDCPFISRTHVLGPAVPADIEEATYLRMSNWSSGGWGVIFDTRKFLESSWPDVYRGMSKLMRDPDSRPDFLLVDYWVEAARDMSGEYDIPLAMHWSQMPTAMLPAPYIPGTPGLQVEVLTSEFATVKQRIRSAFFIYSSLLHYLRYLKWAKEMRASAGVFKSLPTLVKPDYLCLVNSMFGIEAAKDIPPNVAVVGPILIDTVDPPAGEYIEFLNSRSKVLYLALGTHVLLPGPILDHLLRGALAALAAGYIDGIIWAIRPIARKQIDPSAIISVPPYKMGDQDSNMTFPSQNQTSLMTVASLLANCHPSVLFVDYAPQRSLLQDKRVVTFVSHAGPASLNEAVYAGKPVITIPVYFDQIQNALRLRDAGVSRHLNKDSFTAEDVTAAIAAIVADRRRRGPMTTNVERLQGIAKVASRRKHLAADLIEEVLIDWDGRRKERSLGGQRIRGMHLQTADGRMPKWKAHNWDLYGLAVLGISFALGVVVVVPITVALLRRPK